jgi:RHS repeat-associated protein
VGNRLSSLGVSPYNYNSSNELTSLPSGSYSYDKNGNTQTKPDGTQYTWDINNELTQVVLPGTGGTVNFLYDPFGRRIQKSFTQNGTTTTTDYLYDGPNRIEDLANNNGTLTLTARYVDTLGIDEPLEELISGTASYYEQDGLGSVTSLSNSSGALVNTYSYNSYGKLLASTGTTPNPFQYTGREFDTETGAYYYRARYYDQNVGRFISEDQVGSGGDDRYRYVENQPATLVDPLGEASQSTRWRQCFSTEVAFCIEQCASQGKAFESCRVGQTYRIKIWSHGPDWYDFPGDPSCSCEEPQPPSCPKELQPGNGPSLPLDPIIPLTPAPGPGPVTLEPIPIIP